MTRLEKQMEFILEADKLKSIIRQSYIADGSRKEDDADHSWHLALMCLMLKEHSNEEIDALRVISMVLIHDLVEIDAGDTYAYDDEGNSTKRAREVKAAERIFGLLPEDQKLYLWELWEEFEQCETKEAKFANTLDRVQPMLLNDIAGGKAWREHQVKEEQIEKRNSKTPEGSETLWNYCQTLIKQNIEKGNIIPRNQQED